MKLRHTFLYIAVLLVCALPLPAQTTLTPQTRAPLNVNTVTVNGTSGAQNDPHVSQNMASYTDAPSGQNSWGILR